MYEKKWEEWISKSITTDQLLNLGRCLVAHICLTCSTGGAATVLIYDGQDTAGELKLALSVITSTHFGDHFEIPILFRKGLYVDIGSNVTLFTIQYKPIGNK